eukprot:SAG11_NODE_12878_length_681_cov_1.695876_1_plen_119_part_10
MSGAKKKTGTVHAGFESRPGGGGGADDATKPEIVHAGGPEIVHAGFESRPGGGGGADDATKPEIVHAGGPEIVHAGGPPGSENEHSHNAPDAWSSSTAPKNLKDPEPVRVWGSRTHTAD